MKMSVHLIRRGAFVLGALAATMAIVACGSSSTTSSSGSAAASASSTTGSGSGRGGFARNPAQRAKLEACLKQHGVTLPARPPGAGGPPGAGSGSGSGSGSSSGSSTTPGSGGGFGGRRRGFFGGGAGANPKLRAALRACGVNFRGGAGFNPAARKAEVNKFVTCVAQHGYNLPKPNLSGQGPVFPRNIESNSKFQAASKACASDLRPPGAPQGGGGPPASNA
jgi:hypothetical protein